MSISFTSMRRNYFYRVISFLIAFNFSVGSILPSNVSAQVIAPVTFINTAIQTGVVFTPATIKGINIYPDNPLKFDFMIDRGDTNLSDEEFKTESMKLIKYFLASLTVPEDQTWVNLSPYEKDRIIPNEFGSTDMGQEMLAQDFLLKQLTASLLNPDSEIGKKFWERVYSQTQEKFGTTDIPINTFNKIWILPEKAFVYEHDKGAFVVDSHLKVMLEEDYVALEQNKNNPNNGIGIDPNNIEKMDQTSTQMVREVLIPEIEREVNEGKTFANLRQIFNSMILATWYKQALKESILGKAYADQNKIKGIESSDNNVKEEIYNQYVAAFKKGAYDAIKEDYDPATQQVVSRKYVTGGVTAKDLAMAVDGQKANAAKLSGAQKAALDAAMKGFGRGENVTMEIETDAAMISDEEKAQIREKYRQGLTDRLDELRTENTPEAQMEYRRISRELADGGLFITIPHMRDEDRILPAKSLAKTDKAMTAEAIRQLSKTLDAIDDENNSNLSGLELEILSLVTPLARELVNKFRDGELEAADKNLNEIRRIFDEPRFMAVSSLPEDSKVYQLYDQLKRMSLSDAAMGSDRINMIQNRLRVLDEVEAFHRRGLAEAERTMRSLSFDERARGLRLKEQSLAEKVRRDLERNELLREVARLRGDLVAERQLQGMAMTESIHRKAMDDAEKALLSSSSEERKRGLQIKKRSLIEKDRRDSERKGIERRILRGDRAMVTSVLMSPFRIQDMLKAIHSKYLFAKDEMVTFEGKQISIVLKGIEIRSVNWQELVSDKSRREIAGEIQRVLGELVLSKNHQDENIVDLRMDLDTDSIFIELKSDAAMEAATYQSILTRISTEEGSFNPSTIKMFYPNGRTPGDRSPTKVIALWETDEDNNRIVGKERLQNRFIIEKLATALDLEIVPNFTYYDLDGDHSRGYGVHDKSVTGAPLIDADNRLAELGQKIVQYLKEQIRITRDQIAEIDREGVAGGDVKVDSALTAENPTNGGIDFNPKALDMNIKRDGKGVSLPVSQQPIEQFMQLQEFVPVIINIAPIQNLPALLGLKKDDDVQLSKG